MLRLTIILCAFLFATVVIADNTTVESTKQEYINKIVSSLKDVSKSMLLNGSEIPDQVALKLEDGMYAEMLSVLAATHALRSKMEDFVVKHPDKNVSICKDMFNEEFREPLSIYDKTFDCSIEILSKVYIIKPYNDIISDIENCKKALDARNNSDSIIKCYSDASKAVISSLHNSTEIQSKMIQPDENQVELSILICKSEHSFTTIQSQMMEIIERTNECIDDIIQQTK